MRKLVAALFAVLAIAVVAAGCGGGGDSTGSSTADTGSSSAESGESGGATEDEGDAEDGSAGEEEGGSDEAESDGAAPTKAAFIKEADHICSAAETALVEEITSYAEEHGISTEKEPSDDEKVELTEKVVLPNLRGQAEQLEELTPPKGDEATIEDLTSTLSGAISEAEEDPSVVLDGKLLDEAAKKAEAYGLTDCG